jgi:hypothetical protein
MKVPRVIVILILPALLFASPGTARAAEFAAAFLAGYNGGLGFQLNAIVSQFAEGFPFKAKFALGYTSTQPGDALRARRLFINDATNGTPEKKEGIRDFRLDLLYALSEEIYVCGGVRYSAFTGNFRFVGGNEDFNVITNQWGLGLGLEGYFRMNSRIDLVISPGIDYFFQGALSGHDTSYSPDGENVNPRYDFSYADAEGPSISLSWYHGFLSGSPFGLDASSGGPTRLESPQTPQLK